MHYVTARIKLENTFDNPLTAKLIELIGEHVTLRYCDYGNGDVDFEDMTTENNISMLIANDDAHGPMTRVDMYDGHLVLFANYGDDGDYAFSPTVTEKIRTNDYIINPLKAYYLSFVQSFTELYPELDQ